MKNIFLILLLSVLFFSCNNSDDNDQFENPEIILEEINSISKSIVCVDESEWEIIRFGYSSCGFRNQSIAFHSSINREELMEKLESYTEAEKRRIKNQFGEVACLSIERTNALINTFQVVECISGESIIKTKSIFENQDLLGKWKLFSAKNKKWEEVEIQEKRIFFNENGEYNIENSGCKDVGNYSYEETKGVILSSSDCNNKEAFIFIDDFNTSNLVLSYDNNSEIVIETYIRVIE